MVLSLLLHALALVSIELGYPLWWWKSSATWFRGSVPRPNKSQEPLVIEFRPPKPKVPEAPLTFVEVTPNQASIEPPATPKFYSASNSRAANPDTSIDSNIPRVTGTQDKVPKTVDTLRPAEAPPRPAAPTEPKEELAQAQKPPAPKQAEAQTKATEPAEQKPEPAAKGDLQFARAAERTAASKSTDSSALRSTSLPVESRPKPRPRRLVSVLPQDTSSVIVGEKMKQSGGVRRYGVESTLDVKSTEFGAYDAAIIAAIQKRWYDLLDDRALPHNQVGKVVLEFHLTSKGEIKHMTQTENEVGSLLGYICQRAVEEPAPYAEWPLELRRLVGRDYREVRFVFHYN